MVSKTIIARNVEGTERGYKEREETEERGGKRRRTDEERKILITLALGNLYTAILLNSKKDTVMFNAKRQYRDYTLSFRRIPSRC